MALHWYSPESDSLAVSMCNDPVPMIRKRESKSLLDQRDKKKLRLESWKVKAMVTHLISISSPFFNHRMTGFGFPFAIQSSVIVSPSRMVRGVGTERKEGALKLSGTPVDRMFKCIFALVATIDGP